MPEAVKSTTGEGRVSLWRVRPDCASTRSRDEPARTNAAQTRSAGKCRAARSHNSASILPCAPHVSGRSAAISKGSNSVACEPSESAMRIPPRRRIMNGQPATANPLRRTTSTHRPNPRGFAQIDQAVHSQSNCCDPRGVAARSHSAFHSSRNAAKRSGSVTTSQVSARSPHCSAPFMPIGTDRSAASAARTSAGISPGACGAKDLALSINIGPSRMDRTDRRIAGMRWSRDGSLSDAHGPCTTKTNNWLPLRAGVKIGG